MEYKTKKFLVKWLITACLLIFAMVVIGGVTRLTHSGLSIVEWKPLMGALPPMDQVSWSEKFELYKQFPEYQKLYSDMTLAEFKTIFFWEYLHRTVGRLIGIVFLIPFIVMIIFKKLNPRWIKRLLIMFILGGIQAFLGWFMVRSGLIENPYVSHYRLAAHLILAFILMGYIFWSVMDLLKPGKRANGSHLMINLSWIFLGLVLIQVIYGAFTAGLKAGFAFNTFPKMGTTWLPPGYFALTPALNNFTANPFFVQFLHRTMGWILIIYMGTVWYFSRNQAQSVHQSNALKIVSAWIIIQFLLGVVTLILVVPLTAAVLHQAGAVILFLLSLYWIRTQLYDESK
jgi:cytochrome c oxidase assembly protein subunit 15